MSQFAIKVCKPDTGNPVTDQLLVRQTCICSGSEYRLDEDALIKRLLYGLGNCMICNEMIVMKDDNSDDDNDWKPVQSFHCGHMFHQQCLKDMANFHLTSIFVTQTKVEYAPTQCPGCMIPVCCAHPYQINVDMLNRCQLNMDILKLMNWASKSKKRNRDSNCDTPQSKTARHTTTPLNRIDSPSTHTPNLSVATRNTPPPAPPPDRVQNRRSPRLSAPCPFRDLRDLIMNGDGASEGVVVID